MSPHILKFSWTTESAQTLAIVTQDRVRQNTIDDLHDEANLCSVRCTCEVCIDTLRLPLIESHEFVKKVVTCGDVVQIT